MCSALDTSSSAEVTPPLPSGGFIGRYTLDAPLVDGVIGKLYCGKDKYGDHEIVLQFIDSNYLPKHTDFKLLQGHVRDVSWMWSLNIARVYCLRQVQSFTFLIEAFAGKTNLEVLVASNGPRSPRQAIFMARQVADALAIIHKKDILHLHLKPSGILMGDDGLCKLTGLGLTPFYDRRSSLFAVNKAPATPTRTHDLQALGKLLNFLLTGNEKPSENDEYEGKGLISPVLERLLAEDAKEAFPDPLAPSVALDAILENYGGQPEVFANLDTDTLSVVSSPEPTSVDNLDKQTPIPDFTKKPILQPAPEPLTLPPLDEDFEDDDIDEDLSDSMNDMTNFIRHRAGASIEREEWESVKKAKRISRLTVIGILFLLFLSVLAIRFGPKDLRNKGKILMQYYLAKTGLIEKSQK